MKDYHVVMLGASRSGKSSLTTRFVHSTFCEAYDPTIEDIYTKEFSVDNSRTSLEILDTEGIEQFHSMRELYIRNSDAFVLVYDTTNKHSLEEIVSLESQVRSIKGPMAPLLLVGTKSDLLANNKDAGELVRFGSKLASKLDAVHIVTSAKANTNVDDVFETCVKLLRKQDPAYGHSRDNQSVSSASIDGLLYTPSEREARVRHRPTLKASVLKLKKSVVGLKSSKSIRNIRRAVSRASFYHSNNPRDRVENPTATKQSQYTGTPENAPSNAAITTEPKLEIPDNNNAVAPVLQDSLAQPPEMLDVSGHAKSQHRHKGDAICAIM